MKVQIFDSWRARQFVVLFLVYFQTSQFIFPSVKKYLKNISSEARKWMNEKSRQKQKKNTFMQKNITFYDFIQHNRCSGFITQYWSHSSFPIIYHHIIIIFFGNLYLRSSLFALLFHHPPSPPEELKRIEFSVSIKGSFDSK